MNWPIKKLPILLAILACITGCCPQEFFDCFRRPQVMVGEEDVICDYNPILNGFEQQLAENECSLPGVDDERVPLSDEMFEPYEPSDKSFKLAVGDILALNIYDEEETLAESVTVAADGKIYYSFFEGIPAADRTIPEVTKDITEVAKKFFLNPVVDLVPKTAYSQIFQILGRVQKPGVYPTTDPIRVRDAIGVAGGVLLEDYTNGLERNPEESLADLAHSFLIRDGKKLNLNFLDLLNNPNSKQDIYVHPGDYIYIAATPFREVYVIGGVASPARLRYTKGMRLSDALATSGGWGYNDPYAGDMSKVLVIRGCLECPLYVQVDLNEIYRGQTRDILLAPGDIIYMYNKSLRFGRALVRVAITTFIQAFATSAAGYYGQFKWFFINSGSDSDTDSD